MLRVLNTHARIGFSPLNALRNFLVVAGFAISVFTMKVEKGSGLQNVWHGARDYIRAVSGPRRQERDTVDHA
jgi:hypothetical protein